MTIRWTRIVVTMLCLLAAVTSASAEEGQLVKKYGLSMIPVWRSFDTSPTSTPRPTSSVTAFRTRWGSRTQT